MKKNEDCMIKIFFIGYICFLNFVFSSDPKKEFRNYNKSTDLVKQTYLDNHSKQTVEFVEKQHQKYFPLRHRELSIWEVMDILDDFIDESDPDHEKSQSLHAFQTAEKLRMTNQPRWMILTGLIHDLGKILSFFGEPQWSVVGDTFPVGCEFHQSNIFHEFYQLNPDSRNPSYNTKYGIYEPNCGLENLKMSFGHDEYLYQVMKSYLPKEALFIIRFHSFYAAHRHDAYNYLMNEEDLKLMELLKVFSQFDLYSKSNQVLNEKEIIPYYKELVSEFLPEKILW